VFTIDLPTHAHKARPGFHSSRAGTSVGVGSRRLSLEMGIFLLFRSEPKSLV
jgi:hypothetical protein